MAVGEVRVNATRTDEAARLPLVTWRNVLRALSFECLAQPRIAIALITALGALIYLLNINGYPVYTKGEAREAVTIFDIVNGGGIILPMRAGVEIPSKPLLMHWLAALISLIGGGVNTWTVRLPSALGAIGGMIACYLYVRKLFDERVGVVAAIILGTSFQYVQAGTGARVDMTLAFFMEIAFFEFISFAEGLSYSPFLMYVAIALAILTKGPIGAALPLLVAAIWIAAFRRVDLVRKLKLVSGGLMAAMIGGGWYAAAIAVGRMGFVRKQILNENLYRLIGHHGVNVGHAHPFFYEDLALLAGFMPWTLIAIVAVAQALRTPRRIDARVGYLLIWSLAIIVFYNFPQSKRGVYLLAMYPALSVIVATLLIDSIASRQEFRVTTALTRLFGISFFLMGIAAWVGSQMLKQAPEEALAWLKWGGIYTNAFPAALVGELTGWPVAAILLPAFAIVIGAYLLACTPTVAKLLAGTSGGLMVGILAVNLLIEPAVANALSLDHFARAVHELTNGRPMGYFGSLDYDFAFYSGRNLKLVNPRDRNGPDFIVTPESNWNLQASSVTSNYTVLILSNPTNLNGSGRMLLLGRKGALRKLPDFIGLSI